MYRKKPYSFNAAGNVVARRESKRVFQISVMLGKDEIRNGETVSHDKIDWN